ncbi:hypothetical protein COMA1_90014 [Candidatus Nitrospira nitrosa]|uniref:Uncharacterized protein n=1 Tax=Candidatus Nitrospira nitrosa TaxID=1742972 RepID=A0A0S4LSU4_9BACT|nr:hypothetical protein COMA1_90014 [Candidatus Nitrospira nitrosa]
MSCDAPPIGIGTFIHGIHLDDCEGCPLQLTTLPKFSIKNYPHNFKEFDNNSYWHMFCFFLACQQKLDDE